MNFAKFCAYTFVGVLPFCYLLAWAGTKLGQHWQSVSTWLRKADLGISVYSSHCRRPTPYHRLAALTKSLLKVYPTGDKYRTRFPQKGLQMTMTATFLNNK